MCEKGPWYNKTIITKFNCQIFEDYYTQDARIGMNGCMLFMRTKTPYIDA